MVAIRRRHSLSIFAYGNCLDAKALVFPGQNTWQPGMVFWPHSAIEVDYDDEGEVRFDSVEIRGQHVSVDPDQVTPQPAVPEKGFALMVHLLAEYRSQLLTTEEEMARVVPADLPRILRLDNWHHPDVYMGELPSQNDSLCNVAEVLASGDAGRFRPSPSPNVDWRLWLER